MSAALESQPPPPRRARTRSESEAPPPRRAAAPVRAGGAKSKDGRRWLWVIPLGSLALLSVLAVLSFHAGDGQAWRDHQPVHNWAGPAGHGLAWLLFHGLGVSAYGAMLALVTAAALACSKDGLRLAPLATFGWTLMATVTSALTHLLADASKWSFPPGGALGRAVGDAVNGAFSLSGSLVVLSALFLMALLLATHFAAARAFELGAKGAGLVAIGVGRAGRTAALGPAAYVARKWDERRELAKVRAEEALLAADQQEEEEEEQEAREQPPAKRVEVDAKELKPKAPRIAEPPGPPRLVAGPELVAPVPIPIGDDPVAADDATEPGPARRRSRRAAAASAEVATLPEAVEAPANALIPANDDDADGELFPHEPPAPLGLVEAPRGPAIVEPRQPPKPLPTNKPVGDWRMKDGRAGFHLPTVDEILEGETVSTRIIDRLALTATASKLVQKLNDLGVQGEVTEIRPGPVVTMYEFKPAAGVKLSRIASLGDDLAMAMEALRVRIVAPIPGKGVVGFEVPNRTRETVFLKEVVEQEAFQKGGSRLTMAIGKDIEGLPYVSDLAKMPHLLIAGTTGSGKSVGVNAMLVSMLMRATPEELRFIMVDPKMLELSIYDGIPHLLLPVVTDPKKAAMALRWGVEEMERRYELLAAAGVRNIGQYNKHVEKKNEELASRPIDLPVFDENGEPVMVSSSEPEPLKKLPYIVIVIDELADLMMVAAKDVEVYIARLAQMARAAGIHLMVATQRPSTDVLTGVIKANFPSRISFQVASRHDSGTIINTPGAENLLGMGDMLILPPGTSSLTRVHGAYVSETEINRLTGFWKGQGAPVYDAEILRPREEDGGDGGGEDEVADELYDQALHAVTDMKVISISLLQRKMRIGYNRAARMIERMERDGVVGPADGMKPREVLIHGIGREPNL